MTALTFVLLLFLLMALGMPIAFAMIVAGAAGIFWIGGLTAVVGVLSHVPKESGGAYEFLAIPMFLLMAEFVLRSGVADDLFQAAANWFGRVRGGLGIATALAGAGFGAICGSSTASAATLSSTSLPSMLRYGYDTRMASGVVAISGTLSMLIPPSIAMVVYALLANVSVGRMLIAGVIPGILVTFTIALTVWVLAVRNPEHAPLSEPVSWRERIVSLRGIAPMVILMAAVSGAIYTGTATPTEASALGAFCAAVLYFLRGRRTWVEVYAVLARATRTSCMLAFIIMAAHLFTTFFALTQTTQNMVAWVGSLDVNRWVIAIIIIFVILILGFFMDQMAILVLTVPVVAPLLSSLNFDLIWFGVIKIVTAEIGLVTPPLGLNCFVVAKYSKVKVGDVFWGSVPHVIAHLIIIAILVAFPAISLWLPNQMN
ncbi:MAG: TRAP transporter large permease [Amaricoccus sp.]|uniref:TRAP transporter large permease n=1 Tax=Amaricoccus sp. TaxID=1872485 RepID=UPI0039E5A460